MTLTVYPLSSRVICELTTIPVLVKGPILEGMVHTSLLKEICVLNYASGPLMVGSSANLPGGGQKFRVKDIEDKAKEAVDLIADYGLQCHHVYGRASLIMDFGQMKVLRMGSYYELFRERKRSLWGVDLPEDPDYRTGYA